VRKYLVALALTILSVTGCGDEARSLPSSDFALETGATNTPPGVGAFGLGLITFNTLAFEYRGNEKLSEVNVSIDVWYSNGEKKSYKLYQGFWEPKTRKKVQLAPEFMGAPQKVGLMGNAQIGQETVRIGATWLLGGKGNRESGE